MFCVYTYNASTTQAHMKADILAILTGETNKANLSADCTQASTSILTTYDTTDWVSYDTSAYTNGHVIRRLAADGVTYKYFGFDVTNTTTLTAHTYESWNSGTHAATNDISSTNSVTLSAGGVLLIYASPQVILIRASTVTGSPFPLNCFEIDNSTSMIPSGYPLTFLCTDEITGTAPRIKHPQSTGDLTTASAHVFCAETVTSANTQYMKGRIYRDSSENVKFALFPPIWTMGYTTASASTGIYGFMGKALGKMVYGNGLMGAVVKDTIVVGSTTYICIYLFSALATSVSIWVPNG